MKNKDYQTLCIYEDKNRCIELVIENSKCFIFIETYSKPVLTKLFFGNDLVSACEEYKSLIIGYLALNKII